VARLIGITPTTNRPIIPQSKLKWLGSVGDWDYAEYDGTEYCVDRGVILDPGAFSMQQGEIFIGKKVVESIDGSRFEHNNHHRALPVSSGTYATLAARQAERAARLEVKPKPRPLDALATHPFLARRADAQLPIAEPPRNVVAVALSKAPSAIMLPGRSQKRGVQAILAVLQDRGITLHLSPAGTMYAIGVRITTPARSLIEDSRPLLTAHLQGQPLRCELKHSDKQAPEAASLLVGGAAVCEEHLDGEVAP
jgi:hypothetical protein